MKVLEAKLPGVFIIEPRVFSDNRGYLMETWSQSNYAQMGLTTTFVQDNLSFSTYGVLRGLHFQNPNSQGKLVYVLQGEVFDVAVDIRAGSPTFGQWASVILSAENHRQVYIPQGFAHGFCVLSETALFAYKCTDFYNPGAEGGVMWNDPDIAIDWPVTTPVLSEKDRNYPKLKDIPIDSLPKYVGILE